jgi:erythronate-4-phosphate dehydrogenase
MKIVADENIANVIEYFGSEGELTLMPGRSITAQAVREADVLLVRSVTQVDRYLLQHSPCKFVGTATSGIDHLDTQWLMEKKIGLGWARGCNAQSVVDYVFSAMASLSDAKHFDWRNLGFGIVGCGEVGSRLATKLLGLQCKVVIHDPFLTTSHPLAPHFADYNSVLDQDVISFHTPITAGLPWPTRHMLNDANLETLSPDTILINAARGAVIDNKALRARLEKNPEQQVVLDTWEGEPDVNLELLEKVSIATPHIAGYSREGKLNGTRMIHAQFSKFFGLQDRTNFEKEAVRIPLQIQKDLPPLSQLNQLIKSAYDVRKDHAGMQKLLHVGNTGLEFDRLRKTYPIRHEFSAFTVKAAELAESLHNQVRILGFALIT